MSMWQVVNEDGTAYNYDDLLDAMPGEEGFTLGIVSVEADGGLFNWLSRSPSYERCNED